MEDVVSEVAFGMLPRGSMEIMTSMPASAPDLAPSAKSEATADPSQSSFDNVLNDARSSEHAGGTEWKVLNPVSLSGFTPFVEEEAEQEPAAETDSEQPVVVTEQQPPPIRPQPLLQAMLSLLGDLGRRYESSESDDEPAESIESGGTPGLPYSSPPLLSTNVEPQAGLESGLPAMARGHSSLELTPELNAAAPGNNGAKDHRLAFSMSVSKKDAVPSPEGITSPSNVGASHSLESQSAWNMTRANLDVSPTSESSSEIERYGPETTTSSIYTPAAGTAQLHSSDTSAPSAVAVEPLRDPQSQTAEPVKRMSVDLEGTQGQIRLRVEERAGGLRAWVTGSTPAGVENVQAGLSDLAKTLAGAGFESEIWTPNIVHAAGSASDLQASTEQGDRNHYGGQSGSFGQPDSEGQQRGSQSEDDSEDEHSFRSQIRKF